jgi:iron complex outermembrane recepter protein
MSTKGKLGALRMAVLAVAMVFCPIGVYASEPLGTPNSVGQLQRMTIEGLMDIEVTSVSKTSERLQGAAAAIFVITAEDIRRSGAAHIPELFRMVPGLNVARLDSSKWSVSSRGFSDRYAYKLLVLIDGKSVYTPLFSGAIWEVRHVPLEQIEQIEVIRGPGGALWGANAPNGVINIITKQAGDTQGGLLTVGGGTEETGSGSIRYGGSLGEHGRYRLYSSYFARDEGLFDSGRKANDDWQMAQGGFRIDWNLDDDLVTLQGDVYGTDTSQTDNLPYRRAPHSRLRDGNAHYSGGNVLARWERRLANGSTLKLMSYYDYSKNGSVELNTQRDIFDIELQHQFEAGQHHEFIWGLGYRHIEDDTHGTHFASLDPEGRRYRLFSAFAQDTVSLVEDELKLIVGSKFEHNDFTGFEMQPSVRLAWTPNEKHTLWAAVSRSVRTPTRIEHDGQVTSMAFPRILATLVGSRDFHSEDLLAWELGYRVQPVKQLAIDLALFYNEYDDLRTVELARPNIDFLPLPIVLSLPANARNNMKGETYGAELVLDWTPRSWWRMRAAYTFLEMDLSLRPSTLDIVSGGTEDASPEQQAYLQSNFTLPHNMELDVMLRYVDSLPALGIDDYLTMDVRAGWRPKENLEFSIVGQNLFGSSHAEFSPTFVQTVPTQAQRGVYGKLTWRF